jgi:UDP-2,4-diacetamido-2,4,6-trideoxy-beta-L-altropyranose hydrolase
MIGSGHVVRCLALAHAARGAGAQVEFVCRGHAGHLAGLIGSDGFAVHLLPAPAQPAAVAAGQSYAQWLGVSQAQDAQGTLEALRGSAVDWLVVDHYALDAQWEVVLKALVPRMLVIDDLANRPHLCRILLDSSLEGAGAPRYAGLVPPDCVQLRGPRYALLRPEFAALRQASLARRSAPVLDRVLVFMGGSDPHNETARALQGLGLAQRSLRHIDVVVGQGYPFLDALREQEQACALPAQMHVQTLHMAQLMALADLAVTSGGGVSWERCALGLPGMVTIVGDNQSLIAHQLAAAGAQVTLGRAEAITVEDYARHLDSLDARRLAAMSVRARDICDGQGTQRVLDHLLKDAG